ncbi:MAG: sensor domain-containing diguanylate cyclase, partial [Desulfobacterales bacterium]|nr:sensor domain-containing diguanylate cyclase [Desulfobacterales bacterium]
NTEKTLGNNSIQIPVKNNLIEVFYMNRTLITYEKLEEYVLNHGYSISDFKLLPISELVLPIFFQEHFKGLILIDNKLDGFEYYANEKEFLSQLGLILGPYFANAELLQGLEKKVEQRTIEIAKQNQIFRILLEHSTTIELTDDIEKMFDYTLKEIKKVFPDLELGIILNGGRPEIIECAICEGITKEEWDFILKHNFILGDIDINQLFFESKQNKKYLSDIDWMILPMLGREPRVIGNLIIKGSNKLNDKGIETIILFLNQLAPVSENKLLNLRLERMANTDALTGVYNRAYFEGQLKEAEQKLNKYAKAFSIFVIDVNGLKQVNDSMGHEAGDKMIKDVVNILILACRVTDIVCRIGGDEFVILCPATGYGQAQILLNRIREKEEASSVRFSIGLASSDNFSPQEVFKEADKLMYADKAAYYERKTRYR